MRRAPETGGRLRVESNHETTATRIGTLTIAGHTLTVDADGLHLHAGADESCGAAGGQTGLV